MTSSGKETQQQRLLPLTLPDQRVYLDVRREVFYGERKTILLDFDRAWKAKMRAKAA
jgi:hypothetical protein